MVGFTDLINPQISGMQTPAPLAAPVSNGMMTPQNNGVREQWSKLLEDPNMKSAMLRMGLQLMAGAPKGQSNIQSVARAGMDAQDYLLGRNELDRKNAIQDKAAASQLNRDEALIRRENAGTDAVNRESGQNSAKFDEYMGQQSNRAKETELKISNLQRLGKIDDAKLVKAEADALEAKNDAAFIVANPELAGKLRTARIEAPLRTANKEYASIGLAEAQMRASDSTLGVNAANAEQTRQETSQAKALWDSMTPAERKAAKTKPAAGATEPDTTALQDMYFETMGAVESAEKKDYHDDPTEYIAAMVRLTSSKSDNSLIKGVHEKAVGGNKATAGAEKPTSVTKMVRGADGLLVPQK